MRRERILFLAIAIMAVSVFTCNAATVYTRLIDTSFINFKWYDYISGTDGQFNFSSTTISGEKKLYTYDNVYTLNMIGTLTFGPSLLSDYSTGGLAKGNFEGGVSVTIAGKLLLNGNYVYGSATQALPILQATLSSVYDNGWTLEESVQQAGSFERTLFLDLVENSEGLASGITLAGTGDILKMIDPKMDLFLKTSSTVNNFLTDIGPSMLASPIKFTGVVPEPATLVLLGMGLLCLRKK